MSASSEIRSSRATDGMKAPSPFTDDEHDENSSPASRSEFITPTPLPLPPSHNRIHHHNNSKQSSLNRQHSQRESATRVVIFQRDDKGYGLTVSGESPVYVQTVRAGGAAEKAGVRVNDCIIKVNGHLVTKCNHHDVVAHIRSGTYVALTVLRAVSHSPSPSSAAEQRENNASRQSPTQLYPHATTGRHQNATTSHHFVHNSRQQHQYSAASFDSSKTFSSVNNDTYLIRAGSDYCDSSSTPIPNVSSSSVNQKSAHHFQQQSGSRSSLHASSRRHRIDSNVSNGSDFSSVSTALAPQIPAKHPTMRNDTAHRHSIRSDEESDYQRQRYVEQTRIDTLKRMRERETQYLSTLEFRQLANKKPKDSSPTLPPPPPPPAAVANETYNTATVDEPFGSGGSDNSTAMMMAAEDLTSEIAAIKRRVNELDEHIKRECSTVTSFPDLNINLLQQQNLAVQHQHNRQHSSPDMLYTSNSSSAAVMNFGYNDSSYNGQQQFNMHYADQTSSMHANSYYTAHASPPLPVHRAHHRNQQHSQQQQQQQPKKTPSLLALPEMIGENFSSNGDQLRRVSSPGVFQSIAAAGAPVPIVGRHHVSSLNSSISSDSLNTIVPPPTSTTSNQQQQRRLGSFGQVVDRFFAPPPPLPPPNINNRAADFAHTHHIMPSITPTTFSNVALLFSNYDEMCKQGAFLATFIHYLNSTSDSSAVLFDLLCSEYYRLTTSSKISKDLRRKWAFEIHSTFLMPDSPLELVYAFDAGSRAEIVDAIDRAFVQETLESSSSNKTQSSHYLRKVLKDARDRVRRNCIDSLLTQFVANCEWGMDTSIAGMPSENELSSALNSLEKSRTIMEDTIGLDLITVTISGGTREPHVMRDSRQVALGCLFATFLKLRNVKINTPRIDCGPSGNLVDKWPLYLCKQQNSGVLASMLFQNLSILRDVHAPATTHWWSSSMPQQQNLNSAAPLSNSAAQQHRNKMVMKSKSKDSMMQQQQQQENNNVSVGNRLLLLAGNHHKPSSQQQNHNLKPVNCTSTNANNAMIKHCALCGMRLWGVAPQGLQCSQCDLCVHRSCLVERDGVVAEPCIGVPPPASSASSSVAAMPAGAAISAAAANLSKSTSGISLKPASSFIKRIKKRRSAGAGVSAAATSVNEAASTVLAIMSESSKKVIAKSSHHDATTMKKESRTEELHENVVRCRSPQLSKVLAAAVGTTTVQKNENVTMSATAAADSTSAAKKATGDSMAADAVAAKTTVAPSDAPNDALTKPTPPPSTGAGLIPRSESMKARHYTADSAVTNANVSPNKRSSANMPPKMKRKSDPAQISNMQMQLPRSRSDLSSSNGVLLRRTGSRSNVNNNDTTESSSLNSHSRLTPLSSATSTTSLSGGSFGANTATASVLTDSVSISAKSTTTTMTDAVSTITAATEADDDSEPDAAGALSNSSNIMQHLVVDDERPWTQRIDAAVLASMSREEQQRQEICAELLSTERRHVRTLKTLVHIFRDPLRQAQLMPPDMLALVFGHVDELIIVHMRIKQLLKQCLKPTTLEASSVKPTENAGEKVSNSNLDAVSGQDVSTGPSPDQSPSQQTATASADVSPSSVAAAESSPKASSAGAELFGPIGFALQQAFGVVGPNGKQLERAAAAFCSERTEARKVLMRARSKARGDAGTKLNAFLLNASASPWCRRFELQDMLACEMQRLTRYPLLLERLLKYSAANDEQQQPNDAGLQPNYDDSEKHRIQTAIESCRRINSIVNTATQERENYYRLVEFDARLDKSALSDTTAADSLKRYVPFSLLPPARRLLFDGPLVWRLHEKRELILYVMLFDDVLVMLTPTGSGAGIGGTKDGGGSVSGGTAKDALSLLGGVSGGSGGNAAGFGGGAFFAPFAAASMQLSRNSPTSTSTSMGASKANFISAHSFDGGFGTSSSSSGGGMINFHAANQNLANRSYQLKFHERLFGSSETRCTYAPIMELDKLLVKDVATDSRAFFLITATKTPQMYEMLADSQQDRQRWTSKINDAIAASCAASTSMLMMMPRNGANRASHLYEQVPDDDDVEFETNENLSIKQSKSKLHQKSGVKSKKSVSNGGSTITKSVSLIVENSTTVENRKASPTTSTLSSASFSSTHSTASSTSTSSNISTASSAGVSASSSGTLSSAATSVSDAGTLKNDVDNADDDLPKVEQEDFYPVPELPARNFVRRLSDITDHRCMAASYLAAGDAAKNAMMMAMRSADSSEDFSTLLSSSTRMGGGRVKMNTGSGENVPPPLPPRDKLLLMLKQQHQQQNAAETNTHAAAVARSMRRQHNVREYDEPADAAAAVLPLTETSNDAVNNDDDDDAVIADNESNTATRRKSDKKRLSSSVSCPVVAETNAVDDDNGVESDARLLNNEDDMKQMSLPSTTPSPSPLCGADSDVIIIANADSDAGVSPAPADAKVNDGEVGVSVVAGGDSPSAAIVQLADLLYRQAVQLQTQQQQRLISAAESSASGNTSTDAVSPPLLPSINSIQLSQYIQHAARADAMRAMVRQLVQENEMLKKAAARQSNDADTVSSFGATENAEINNAINVDQILEQQIENSNLDDSDAAGTSFEKQNMPDEAEQFVRMEQTKTDANEANQLVLNAATSAAEASSPSMSLAAAVDVETTATATFDTVEEEKAVSTNDTVQTAINSDKPNSDDEQPNPADDVSQSDSSVSGKKNEEQAVPADSDATTVVIASTSDV